MENRVHSQYSTSVELTDDHEEADTTLFCLAHATNVIPGEAIMIRSPSGHIIFLFSS